MGLHSDTMAPWFHEVTECHSDLHDSIRSCSARKASWLFWALQNHHGPLVPQGLAVSHWPLASMGTQSVTMAPGSHQTLQCHSGFLGSPRPCGVSRAPWFHGHSQCQNGLIASTRPCSVTMGSLAPQGPAEPVHSTRPQSVRMVSRIP